MTSEDPCSQSRLVEACQICASIELEPVIFLGYLPPVNTMPEIGSRPVEQAGFPAELLRCSSCGLAQLGLAVDAEVLFPPDYPYTSGTTRILRENFAQLAEEATELYPQDDDALVVDIGSNDGTLLINFKDRGYRVRGVEPTRAGELAEEKGIPTTRAFFDRAVAEDVRAAQGPASIVTAANVFAHIDGVNDVVEAVLSMLDDDGIFISENHYLLSLIQTVQYDTIYHEHLRYYSLGSLQALFEAHDMEIIHAREIPTHGGSVRVYAARRGRHPVRDSVERMLDAEAEGLTPAAFEEFREAVVRSKVVLYRILDEVRREGGRVFGVAAPSRASTLINYLGLDDELVDCVVEIKGSRKIGKYIPGTKIPVLEESVLYEDQPGHVLLLAWHIADELVQNLSARGFRGKFIVPLPVPHVRSAPAPQAGQAGEMPSALRR